MSALDLVTEVRDLDARLSRPREGQRFSKNSGERLCIQNTMRASPQTPVGATSAEPAP